MKSLKKGFTLAEVLITLGIIGVVAALTIPALTQSYQTQVYKSQLKKQMSTVGEAFKQAAIGNGGSLAGYSTITWNTNSISDDLINFMKPYFAYQKICYSSQLNASCRPVNTNYTTLSGGDISAIGGGVQPIDEPLMILNDGTILYFFTYYLFNPTCTSSGITSTKDGCGSVIIDVNGTKSPNQLGLDTFMFWIGSTGTLVPWGTMNDGYKNTYSTQLGYTNIINMLN
jgi:prepilin-type N-terminal cleavage/methylation domain-containing protein